MFRGLMIYDIYIYVLAPHYGSCCITFMLYLAIHDHIVVECWYCCVLVIYVGFGGPEPLPGMHGEYADIGAEDGIHI